MIRGLLYLIASRPDITKVICLVAIFQANKKQSHDHAIKRIFRYLNGTLDFDLWYKNNRNFMIKVYTDVDWIRSVDNRKSTTGGAFFLGDRLVSWLSKKQDSISLSLAEA